MRGNPREHRLHVLGQHIAATCEQRAGARGSEQGQTRARTEADADIRVRAAGGEQRLHVIDQGGTRQHCGDGSAQGGDLRCIQTRLQLRDQRAAIGRGKQGAFGIAIRIFQTKAQHEAIQLRIRQWIGARQFHRILRGDDEKRRRQRMRGAIGGNLLFGHRLEQGALGFRRGAVDFVGEYELREQWAWMEFERALLALVHAHADNVRGQEVGRELDALERKIERGGECVRESGLAHAGQILDQQMSAGEKTGKGQAHLRGLAKHDAVHLRLRARQGGAETGIQRRRGGNRRKTRGVHEAISGMMTSIGNVRAQRSLWPLSDVGWRMAFWLAWALLLIAKIILAVQLAPFGDEAWYWQESRHLTLGYSDLPPLTAWLIATGEVVFGHSTLAMRAPFLALGALLPLIVVRMAARVFGARAGWCAGLLALGLPLLGTLGIFALPDVPLTFAAAWALDAFERATRERRWGNWIALGFALALACLAHYRAAMLLFAGLIFGVASVRGRTLWREPGLWLALALAIAGTIPTLLFNLRHDWVALDFQLLQRNPWSFHADALVQPLEQALVCTPLFYALLLWALWQVWKRRRDGAPWDLFAVCAAVPMLAYFFVGLFADDTRFRAHWPLPGYLSLLIVLPVLLREAKIAAWFRTAAFVLLALGNILAFAYLGVAAIPDGTDALARMKAFPQQFVGWREAAAETRALLAQPRFAGSVLVADNFMLAAELDFALDGSRPVYSLDHPLNAKHGRAPQLVIWQRDEAGLRTLGAGHRVLLVVEPGARRERQRATWLDSLCSRIDDLAPVARLDAYAGRKRYRWYAGVVAVSGKIGSSPGCIAAQP